MEAALAAADAFRIDDRCIMCSNSILGKYTRNRVFAWTHTNSDSYNYTVLHWLKILEATLSINFKFSNISCFQ